MKRIATLRAPVIATLMGGSLACNGVSQLQLMITEPCPAPSVATSGWQLVEIGGVSLRLPPELMDLDTQPIDTRTASYGTSDGPTVLDVDYGFAADPLGEREEWLSYSRCTDEIGGRSATLISARSRNAAAQSVRGQLVVGATWRDVEPGISLTALGYAQDSTWHVRLLAALRTVEFAEPVR